jgi:hypothetical protein
MIDHKPTEEFSKLAGLLLVKQLSSLFEINCFLVD